MTGLPIATSKTWHAAIAASEGQQTSAPAHTTQSPMDKWLAPLIRAAQPVLSTHVASRCAVSPVVPEHVHVTPLPLVAATATAVQGGHVDVSAQQPLAPGLEPSRQSPADVEWVARRSATMRSLIMAQ